MDSNSFNATGTGTTHDDDDDDENNIEDLDFTFDDVDEESFVATNAATAANSTTPMMMTSAATTASAQQQSATYSATTTAKITTEKVEDDFKKATGETNKKDGDSYILGTLIVRVVAARDLDAVERGGLGNLIFGGGKGHRTRSSYSGKGGGSGNGGGTANPYATVRFGSTTQRTSEVYGTTDPIWPRGEIMYMDVTHPSWENDYDEYMSCKNGLSSKENLSIASNTNKCYVPTTFDYLSEMALENFQSIPKPILTIGVFHASQDNRYNKYPNKKGPGSGDSDDTFLGMTSIDMTQLFTGKTRSFDEWIPLQGAMSSRASIRIVCEYEASDAPPVPGDVVKFTDYCHPADLYPAVQVGRVYTVHEVDGDEVLISWTSPEGWVSSFLVHRFMLICIERHQSVVGICQDELASLRERIAYSPLVHVVQETVERVPDDGLIGIGAETIKNGVSLLSRWWDNGFETAAQDLTFATNWDGRHNPSADTLATNSDDENDDILAEPVSNEPIIASPMKSNDLDLDDRLGLEPPLPNMPPCPITGEPMRDPVVAADGHTYERIAIARWLSTSNKSPLTGAILAHKELVPNYMLLSSLQEAAAAAASAAASTATTPSFSTTLKTTPNLSIDESILENIDVDDAKPAAVINIQD